METENGLLDMGTRYQHLCDLRDMWEQGKLVAQKYNNVTDSDTQLIISLELAISLVNKQLDIYSEFSKNRGRLMATIDAIPKDPTTIPVEDSSLNRRLGVS